MEVTLDELRRRLGEEGFVLVDVRNPLEFEGEAGYPCDPRQGHIPGAVHLDLQELLTLTPAQIAERLPAGAEIVTYCHSGSRSELAAQVLRAAGYEARNYLGSWHEWSRDESLPAETGAG